MAKEPKGKKKSPVRKLVKTKRTRVRRSKPAADPVGQLPAEIAQYIGPRLELGEILFSRFSPEQLAGFDLGRFGDPDVPARMCDPKAKHNLAAMQELWKVTPEAVSRGELTKWLLAIGLTAAHLRDNNITLGGGIRDLLNFYEFAGECSQILRWFRTGQIADRNLSPIQALDWFSDLVPTVPGTPGMSRGVLERHSAP